MSETVELGAGRPEVWEFVTDPDNFGRYVAGFASVGVTSEHATGVGASYVWHARLGPLRLQATERVAHWDPPSEVRYEGRMAGVAFRSAMTIEEAAGGRSLLTAAIESEPGPVAFERLVDRIVGYELHRSLARVARLFPAGGQPGLDAVEDVYAGWGRHPALYAAQDPFTFLGKHRVIRRRAAEAMEVGRGARVLEVACGTGRDFPYIEEVIGPDGELVAFDYCPEMLAAARGHAQQSGWQNIRFVQGDAAVLEVGDEPFDGVVCVLGMSAIPDHVRAIGRCHEVLRPGGVLSVCDGRLFTGRLAALNPLVRRVYTRLAGWDPNKDIPGELRRVFNDVTIEEHNLGTFFIAAARRST